MISYRLSNTIINRATLKKSLFKFADIFLILFVLASLHLGFLQHSVIYPIILVSAGILILPLLFARSKKIGWDRIIGELSYPVYLSHMLIGWLVIGILSKIGINTPLVVVIVFMAVIITSIIVNYFILIPLEQFRNRFKPQPTSINDGETKSSF
jgi:peptidoglycan/LPS O-acetylase OafA/YrhL